MPLEQEPNLCFFKLVHVHHVILRPRSTDPHSPLSPEGSRRTEVRILCYAEEREIPSWRDPRWRRRRLRPPRVHRGRTRPLPLLRPGGSGGGPGQPRMRLPRRPRRRRRPPCDPSSSSSSSSSCWSWPRCPPEVAIPAWFVRSFSEKLDIFFNTTNAVCAFGFLILVSLFVFINFRAGILHIDFLMWQP